MHEWTFDQLCHSVDGLDAIDIGVRIQLLNVVLEIDRRELYKQDGSPSTDSWLAYRRNWSRTEATGFVDFARRLAKLRLLKEALSAGSVSWQNAVEVSKVATEEDEDWWVREAEVNSYARVRHLVRLAQRTPRQEVTEVFQRRGVWFTHDGKGLVHIKARLPEADASLVRKALDRIEHDMGPDNHDGTYNPARMRDADALIELASISLGAEAEPDTPQVVVHVDIRDLNKLNGTAVLDDGGVLGSTVARRLACDSKLQIVINMPNGDVYAISRNQRTVPRWQRRLLMKRDKGCRFADCGRTRGLVPHHIIHWAHGGETILENLVLLCPYHHHLVHESGWSIRVEGDLELRFIRPDGRLLNYRPVPLREPVKERIFGPPQDIELTTIGSRE